MRQENRGYQSEAGRSLQPAVRFLLLGFFLAGGLYLPGAKGQATKRTAPPPNYEQRLAVLQHLEVSVVPLYIVGDVNEDGRVDDADRVLIRMLAQYRTKPEITPAGTCPAAADLSLNGEIDDKDVAIIDDWLKDRGVVSTPALASQSFLPCKYSNMFVAAKLDVRPGGVMPIRFLDLNLTTANCTVTVHDGRGVVKPTADGRGFDVQVPTDAKAEDTVTALVTLPEGKRFYYTFPIRPFPPTTGKGP